ncbi:MULTISPECIES: cytochrome P450 [Rhodococcus]|uniref:Cytochrome P450 n=1 Tax=Rhodococcus oxybenzonivorans TaxID=1990687 RepID=A0AAE4V1V2_9NOCA|nr:MULTISPECIES: cytochrome P450 [Rhodococcus]MDV7241339.1 cytochrome P450 [Rhodococcus oxybenzonivorans]MDV7266837.1 cytochrome P450 [Rhodococcus oxybenzonivorans]MDV7274128.1 cytochrome P450 [Rhodococcus oxybenzonivorans]MDV7333619.1 cytochrome P450 [Rhodococcus oxybenzonivorans]MDV7343039.1 cytochrome P450 [Rhodococcus oxybenzonivorans]
MQLEDVDLYDPDTYVNGVPHEMFAALRRDAPIYRHYDHSGQPFWCVTRHADIVAVNRDATTYSSWRGATYIDDLDPADLAGQQLMMLNMDPPDHTALRKIVSKGFTPRRIGELHDILARRATTIVDAVIERGECDFVVDVASELPLQAIADFLGVPQEDRKLIFDLTNQMIGSSDPEFHGEAGQERDAAAQMFAYSQSMFEDRQQHPRDDIATALIKADVHGEKLSELDFNMFFMLLAVAGNETTRNAISHTQLALMEHPDQRRKVLDDPAKLDSLIEEGLRWATPVMQFRRTATTDTVLGGVEIAEGDRVVIWHMSGNRDEAVFDDPYAFDIDRSPNHHVAFGGGGHHFCLGANLARAEMKVMLAEILRRMPDMEQTEPAQRLRSNFINGLKHLPVQFTPAAPS